MSKKSTLRDSITELLENPPLRSGYPCKISRIYSELDTEDRRALEDLIDQSKISASAISRLLNQNGFEIKYATIAKHRRRADGSGCRCPHKADE